MNWVIEKNIKRILAAFCVLLIALLQIVFVMPSFASPEAGEQLAVRVQYAGEPGGKIRTITVFSNSDLKAIGAHNQMFTNITRVGTVMRSAAYGVELANIIDAAGIDLDSVETFTFRAKDGYTMTFSGGDYLGSTGWYYPELVNASYRIDQEDSDGALQMNAGALDGGMLEASAILALKSYSTKSRARTPSYDKMTTDSSYRFFTGQTDLSYLRYEDEEGNEAFYPTTENDITAWDSVQYIYGVDVVLKGTPPLEGISLNAKSKDIKVGSQQQIQVTFKGDTMGIFNSSDVTWTSSDEAIATVDKNGRVTIRKAGEVTITASVAGYSASVTLNGTTVANSEKKTQVASESQAKKSGKTDQAKQLKTPQDGAKEKASEGILLAREIQIGKEIKQEEIQSGNTAQITGTDSTALEAVETYDKKTVAASSAVALLACAGGAVFRVRRYHFDLVGHRRR